jgi:hypothetical protein
VTNDISQYSDSPWYIEDGIQAHRKQDGKPSRDDGVPGAVAISESRKAYVRAFAAELQGLAAAGHADSAQTLEYALMGYGWYSLRTEDGIYIQIGIPETRVVVSVEYTLTRGLADAALERIARDTGVETYHQFEDGVVSEGPGTLGFPSVEIFPDDSPVLTVDGFIQDRLFKVSMAGEAVRKEQGKLAG